MRARKLKSTERERGVAIWLERSLQPVAGETGMALCIAAARNAVASVSVVAQSPRACRKIVEVLADDVERSLRFGVASTSISLPRPIAPYSEISSAERASTPGQVAVAEWEVPIALPGYLEDRIGNARLHRGATVVTHATQPMPRLEESDVDLRRILVDARQWEAVEVVLRNAAFGNIACLKHRVVVEPGNLALDLLPDR